MNWPTLVSVHLRLIYNIRYYGSQLLAGSILVQDQAAILLNTVEPYSRDSLLDAHYERRSSGSASSFPSVPSQYGYLSTLLLSTADGDKLVIGTRTCNFLIMSSIRLDKESVNLGAMTSPLYANEIDQSVFWTSIQSISPCLCWIIQASAALKACHPYTN